MDEQLTLAEACRIAKAIDPEIDHYSEYENGFHFIRSSEMYDISDPGFAVSKEDGKVYYGFDAHMFLKGDIRAGGRFSGSQG